MWNELDVWVRKIGIPAMDAIRSADSGNLLATGGVPGTPDTLLP